MAATDPAALPAHITVLPAALAVGSFVAAAVHGDLVLASVVALQPDTHSLVVLPVVAWPEASALEAPAAVVVSDTLVFVRTVVYLYIRAHISFA